MAACEAERMGKHMAAYARGRQPRCMSAAACVPATCEHRCVQACALPKCVPRTAKARGSCWRTVSRTHRGWPEAHTSTQASAWAHADAWGGKPTHGVAGSTAGQEKGLGAEAGEGKHKRRRVGGRCWHLCTSADDTHAGVPAAGAQPGVREASPQPWVHTHRPGAGHRHSPATLSSFLCRAPCPAQHHRRGAGPASGAGSAASHHQSLARNLCSAAGHECSSLLPFPVSAPVRRSATGVTLEV